MLVLALAGDARAEPCACSDAGSDPTGVTGSGSGARDDLEAAGIALSATYAGEVFAASGLDTPVRAAGLVVLGVDLDLALLADARLGTVHLTGLAIHGNGPSAELMDIYGSSSNLAEPDVRVFEAWYEQPIGPFAIRAGLLSADQEFVIADHSTSLLNATFGIHSQFSFTVVGPVYPVGTPGASARVETDEVTVRAAIYDGSQTNRHGIPTELADSALVFGELEAGLAKVGGWYHDTRGSGGYLVLDRHVSPLLGVFGRASLAEGPVSHYVDAGFRVGPLRGQDFASAGFAFGQTDDGEETLVEVGYQIQSPAG